MFIYRLWTFFHRHDLPFFLQIAKRVFSSLPGWITRGYFPSQSLGRLHPIRAAAASASWPSFPCVQRILFGTLQRYCTNLKTSTDLCKYDACTCEKNTYIIETQTNKSR